MAGLWTAPWAGALSCVWRRVQCTHAPKQDMRQGGGRRGGGKSVIGQQWVPVGWGHLKNIQPFNGGRVSRHGVDGWRLHAGREVLWQVMECGSALWRAEIHGRCCVAARAVASAVFCAGWLAWRSVRLNMCASDRCRTVVMRCVWDVHHHRPAYGLLAVFCVTCVCDAA